MWSEERGGFIINLPKIQVTHPPQYLAQFKGEILGCFDEKKNSGSAPRQAAVAVDDWAEVIEIEKGTKNLAVIEKPTSTPAKINYIPDFNTLARPDELLLRPPYHLSVYLRDKTEFEVQCSHSPTLQFLADYLKKWTRVNHQMNNKVSFFFSFPDGQSGLLTGVAASCRRSAALSMRLWAGTDL
jgi:hypothetical protein